MSRTVFAVSLNPRATTGGEPPADISSKANARKTTRTGCTPLRSKARNSCSCSVDNFSS